MPAQIVTTDDLLSFKQELLDELKEVFSQNTTQTKQWLRSSEVRKMLAISPGTLQNLRINGTLPYSKVGGVIYYPYDGIMKVMEENLINAHQL